MAIRIVHADGIITGDREPLRDGAVVFDEEGTIADVGPAGLVLPRHVGAEVLRIRGVVMPGLVNAHTHVELSALRGQVAGGAGFVPWVEALIGARAELEAEHEASAIDRAVQDLDASGTAAVGEVSNGLATVRRLARAGIGGIVFHEVYGLVEASAEAAIAGMGARCEAVVGAWPTTDLVYAPAPHTLYTTHPAAVRALLRMARDRGARSSVHLAEHAGERRVLEQGDGPVAEWLATRMRLPAGTVAWPRRSPVDYADDLGALAPDVLAVHLADARPEELARVAERGAPVVLCPRSNLFIDLKLPPLPAIRAAGIEAALGTDSLASNASLDVLAEARALADRFPGTPANDLLRMATWNGARALGRPDLGRIAKGARPGLVAIEGETKDADPCAFVLRNVREPRRWIARRAAGGAS